jgi:hypothetical protein
MTCRERKQVIVQRTEMMAGGEGMWDERNYSSK